MQHSGDGPFFPGVPRASQAANRSQEGVPSLGTFPALGMEFGWVHGGTIESPSEHAWRSMVHASRPLSFLHLICVRGGRF